MERYQLAIDDPLTVPRTCPGPIHQNPGSCHCSVTREWSHGEVSSVHFRWWEGPRQDQRLLGPGSRGLCKESILCQGIWVWCFSYLLLNSRLPYSLEGEPAPVLFRPMLPVPARLLPKGYLSPEPAGASMGELAAVELAERGWPKFICGRLSRLILCSGRLEDILDYGAQYKQTRKVVVISSQVSRRLANVVRRTCSDGDLYRRFARNRVVLETCCEGELRARVCRTVPRTIEVV